ncbi:ribonuclease VapC [Gemmatimonadetes bacterium T265]|nr:ribonuclease VapC [Gemmatimonadetes bacterium T265]
MTNTTPLMLDTNVVFEVLRPRPSAVRDRLTRTLDQGGRAVAVSSIVLVELWYGVGRSAMPALNAELLRRFLAGGVNVVSFAEEQAEAAGALRTQLERAGTPVGPYDVLIAAHAVTTGSTLVTANVGEFSRFPGLTVEDWSRPA